MNSLLASCPPLRSYRKAHELFHMSPHLPDASELNAAFPHLNPYHFVPQAQKIRGQEVLSFDEQVATKKEIRHRANHLHDYLNALVWCYFKKSKHIAHLKSYQHRNPKSPKNRTLIQQRLAQFDEAGMLALVPTQREKEALLALMQNRSSQVPQEVFSSVKWLCYGHSLMELILLGKTHPIFPMVYVDLWTEDLELFLAEKLGEPQKFFFEQGWGSVELHLICQKGDFLLLP